MATVAAALAFGLANSQPARVEKPATSLASHVRMDAIEDWIRTSTKTIEVPVEHVFTPGLYVRRFKAEPGTLAMSKIHKTEHPFAILSGSMYVWMDEEIGWKHFAAGHLGITKPGSRRICYTKEGCHWTTFHPTQETDVGAIEEQIIEKHDVALARAAEYERLAS